MAYQTLIDRFTDYCKIDTGSDPWDSRTPSTAAQWELLRLLQEQCEDLGLETEMSDHGYLFATIPASDPGAGAVPPLALLAHVDTAPEVPTGPVHPQFTYVTPAIAEGGLHLNDTTTIDPADLRPYVGEVAVTSDGRTLLGVDDKSGLAALVELVQRIHTRQVDGGAELADGPDAPAAVFAGRNGAKGYESDDDAPATLGDLVSSLRSQGIVPRRWPAIRLVFTPDEEIARGLPEFDANLLHSHGALHIAHAYTIDGSVRGRYNEETFSARMVRSEFCGYNKHTGYAAEAPVLTSAVVAAADFIGRVRASERPAERARGHQGFAHTARVDNCAVECCTVTTAVRDFADDACEARAQRVVAAAADAATAGGVRVASDVSYQYGNMLDLVQKTPALHSAARRAYTRAGAGWEVVPVRGGTDGAMLAKWQVAAPNIFVAGRNFHSKTEITTVEGLYIVADTIAALVEEWVTVWEGSNEL